MSAELVIFGGLMGEFVPSAFNLLEAADIPWLIATSLQSLLHVAFSSVSDSSYVPLIGTLRLHQAH